MLVVIFRAKVRQVDDEYLQRAERLRTLAFERFGCLGFHSSSEGQEEITLSYFPDAESIAAWKAHPDHLQAQRLGRERYYEWYSVEVAEVTRRYEFPAQAH